MKTHTLAALLLAAGLPLAALATGQHNHGHGHGHSHDMPASHGNMTAAGQATLSSRPGDPDRVTRAIEVVLSDDMRFTPSSLDVKAGETIRFFVHNVGQVDHEMVIGQLDDLKAHAREMQDNPGMPHKEPNQVYLKPGERGDMVWQFSKAGTVDFACTVPGHLEAGMVGKVTVR